MLTEAGELLDEFSVPCRDCGVVARQKCINSITGLPLRRVSHAARIRDATKIREELADDD
jgi:hypothetical protein